ncbi:haloacid dehalogenase-like hydrolase domain-containing protein 3 [Brevipalpus obovatus]|uniref:haloacid dehalogenase-like hydrolase domain-containing protein 3 n=1 Tax=Brevipalpus obovatus TaxID=246614 RepID=UPI003D9F8C25
MAARSLSKLITFDATNTILRLKTSVGHEYCAVAKMYGLQGADNQNMCDRVDKNFKTVVKEMKQESPMYGINQGTTNLRWWSEVVKRVLIKTEFPDLKSDDARIEQVSVHLYKVFSTSEPYELVDGVNATLKFLKIAVPRLKLGVISNSDERLDEILAQLGVRHYFSFLILPQLDKVEKPSPEAFALALKKANINDPSQALHVGDSVEKDYLGAKRSSWNAALIDNTRKSLTCKDINQQDVIKTIQHLTSVPFFKL